MKIFLVILMLSAVLLCLSFGLRQKNKYKSQYMTSLGDLKQAQTQLRSIIEHANLTNERDIRNIKHQINFNRNKLKAIDLWLRYLEPIAYKKINGPLPVEWETETFEKYEPPYKRQGGGLTLAELALDEHPVSKETLLTYIDTSLVGIKTFEADSITKQLESYHHFFLANRLYLLNLAAVYTTGFECPDMNEIIPELRNMLSAVQNIYSDFNSGFSSTRLSDEYLELYDKAIKFAHTQQLTSHCSIILLLSGIS